MKEATETFALDNGTVYEGQRFPDAHVAPRREPGKFKDVSDEDNVTVVDGTDATPASQPATATPAVAADSVDDAGKHAAADAPADTSKTTKS